MKKIFLLTLVILFLTSNLSYAFSFNKKGDKMLTLQEYSKTIIFPIGNTNDAYAKYFIGQSYLAPVSTEQVKIYNVTFEPKCRNNWHIHRAKSGGGQMLIAVGGRG